MSLNLLNILSINHFLYYILYYINRDDRKKENNRKRDNERNRDKRNGDKINWDNEINRDNNRNNIKRKAKVFPMLCHSARLEGSLHNR